MKNQPITVYPLFSSPLCETYIDKVSDSEEQFLLNSEFERMFSGNGYISVNKYILNTFEMANLKKEIMKRFEFYVRDFLKISDEIGFRLTTSWVVKHSPGDFADIHTHLNSVFSGVVYLKVMENSGDIIFHRNNSNSTILPKFFSSKHTEWNIYNCERYRITPENRKILFFSSLSTHSIDKNSSNEDRYSLAFNFFPTGKFGFRVNELYLN